VSERLSPNEMSESNEAAKAAFALYSNRARSSAAMRAMSFPPHGE